MKKLSLILFSIIFAISFQSCNDKNSDKKEDNIVSKDSVKQKNNTKTQVTLINIPEKISEESKRYEIDTNLIAIDVFSANFAMNEGTSVLEKMFPESKITPADATEVFDSFNIESKGKKYCGIITYEQNDNEEFVIHTIFIAEGFFNDALLGKIFS